ncbi:MAG: toll/interleukin-1 receptor domain-containing protein [Hyphomonadaceae bacterium]
MADVFISYAREDRARVEAVNQALRELELDVWIDARLTPGVSFREEIRREAEAAKAMIVCWTPDAAASAFVIDEATIGRDRGVLAPVFLAACAIPMGFGSLNTIDLCQWKGALDDPDWLRIVRRLEDLTRKPELTRVAEVAAHGGPAALPALVRRLLIRQAVGSGLPLDYKEVEALVRAEAAAGRAALPADFDQPLLWNALNEVAAENRKRGEPPLPCLVINRGTGRPGRGYFRKHAFLVNDFDPMAHAIFERHLERVRGYAWPAEDAAH